MSNDSDRSTPETEGTGPARDPVAEAILAAVAEAGPGHSVSPQDVATRVAEARRRKKDPPDLWRRYLPAVKQQAIHLARGGEIVVLRKGEPVEDPAHVKGMVRYALPG